MCSSDLRTDQDDAQHVISKMREELHRFAEKVVHGRDGFDPGEPTPSDDKIQERHAVRGPALEVRLFQIRNKMVAQHDRITQRFHRERAIGQSWDAVEVRGGPEGQHEMVKWQRVAMVLVPMRHADSTIAEINGLDLPMKERHLMQQLADGADDIGNVEVARGHFVQHGRKEEKIVVIHEGDVEIGAAL